VRDAGGDGAAGPLVGEFVVRAGVSFIVGFHPFNCEAEIEGASFAANGMERGDKGGVLEKGDASEGVGGVKRVGDDRAAVDIWVCGFLQGANLVEEEFNRLDFGGVIFAYIWEGKRGCDGD